MSSIIRTLIKQSRDKEKNIYNSHLNYIFYGEVAKSTTAAALSKFSDEPVLLISPAGGSTYLENDFKNIISYPVSNLNELRVLIDDLDKNMEAIRRLQLFIAADNKERIQSAKEYYEGIGEDWEYIYNLAKNNKFPISALVVEELSVISSWIHNEVEEKLDIVSVGNDKKNMGGDWNVLKRDQMDFFTKLLKFPCTTILSTGSRMPGESQKDQIIAPNICVGAAQRQLVDLIGNIFYFYKDDAGNYKVRLTKDKKVFAKDKLLSPYTNQKLPDEIDITGKPELFWETLSEMKKKDNEHRKQMEKSGGK